VFVAASTECFGNLPLQEAIEKLGDLQYANVEVAICEDLDLQLKPSEVAENVEKAAALCCDTHRLNVVAYDLRIAATGDEFLRQFTACCELAKATKVYCLTVPSSEFGTPFNEEVERLRELVGIATREGVLVAMKTESGRLSQDLGTIEVLCDNVKGLGITLDPSHFIYGQDSPVEVESVLKYVYNVNLRDTTKDALQVRVGQGEVDYGRLIMQLQKLKYGRALSVHVTEDPDIDHDVEMRKIRMLLDSHL